LGEVGCGQDRRYGAFRRSAQQFAQRRRGDGLGQRAPHPQAERSSQPGAGGAHPIVHAADEDHDGIARTGLQIGEQADRLGFAKRQVEHDGVVDVLAQ
jgi:hypothetical protein